MVAGLIGILMVLVTTLTVLGTLVAGGATRSAGPGAASAAAAAPTIVSASTCHATVAVLGADMTAPQREEVRGILGVDGGTVQLTETLADEEAQAQGLIPPELLLDQATSSVLFRPEPRGSGLTVSVNPAITLDTPRTYANALLTAGVTDASVTVAAPTGLHAPVLGTTALLGLLRAAQAACGDISQERRNLAIREVVLTSQLAQQVGRDAAPILLTAAKANAVEQHSTDPAALGSILSKVSTVKGIRVPPLLEPATVAFLASLVSSGTYARVAAGTPLIRPAGEHGIHVSLSGQGTAPPPAQPGLGTPLSGQPTQRPISTTTTARGTLLSVGPTKIGVQQSNGPFTYPLGPGLAVTRNGESSSLGALKKGDTVTIALNGSGAVTNIYAQSPGAPPPGAALSATAVPVATSAAAATGGTGFGGLSTSALAALAGLILLLLVAIPLLFALLRRRRRPRRTVTTAATTVSTTTVMPAVTPLPRPDAREQPVQTRVVAPSRERAVGIRPRQSPSQRKRRNRK